MKKTDFLYLLIIMLLIYSFAGSVLNPGKAALDMEPLQNLNDIENKVIMASAEPSINARSAVVIDFETGSVLFEKNAYSKRPMASTTKIMTAIVALENSSLQDDVVISAQAANMDGSTMGLKTGSVVKMKDLLYGLLVCSGNDAAIAIAEHVGGTVPGFVELMNKKAIEIGAYSTNFQNPHGLDNPNHYTTAYDLAKIARYALKNSTFNEIVKTKQYFYNGRTLNNTNEMLSGYEGADGVKTGYTGLAGRCLVTSVTKNDMRFISVVLFCDTRNLRSQSSRDILNYAYNQYGYVKLLNQGSIVGSIKVDRSRTASEIEVAVSEDLKTILRHTEKDALYTRISIPSKITAPVKRGSVIGTASIFFEDRIIAETSLIAMDSAEKKELGDYIKQVFNQWMGILCQ